MNQSFDDFIIADEEPEQPQAKATPKTAPKPGPSQPQSLGLGLGFLPWNAKIDLSSSFTPFTNSKAFTDNNTVREHQYTGGDTLDEPVWSTLSRDLLRIWNRLTIVIWPAQLSSLAKKQQGLFVNFAQTNGINLPALIMDRRVSVNETSEDFEVMNNLENLEFNSLDWDLWGPLMFSLAYSVTLGMSASSSQTNSVFSGSFSFIWIFFIVIGLNIQLLGGNISFMSAISAVGYSMFPLAVGELVCSVLVLWKLVRLGIMAVLCAWSIYSGILSLKCSGVLPGRVLLAVYPVGLMYGVLGWLAVIT